MTQPKITIGMTCFNAPDTIVRAIDSAVAQDWENKELLIIDDVSKDNSVEVIRERIKDIPYARLIVNTVNNGFAGCLNTMIREAKGEFLVIFDDDDISYPYRLTEQYEALVNHEKLTGSNLVAAYAATEKIYPNGYVLRRDGVGIGGPAPAGDDMIKFHLYLKRPKNVFYGSGTPTSAVMARISTLKVAGDYDIALRRNEDSDFAIRLALKGGHFIGTKNPLIKQMPSGGTDKKPEIAYESDQIFLNKYASILKEHGRYDYAMAWSKIKYLHYAGKDGQALLVFLKSLLQNPILNISHFFRAGPARLLHERKMRR